MRKIGQDRTYTDEVITKKALDRSLRELTSVLRWSKAQGVCCTKQENYILERIHKIELQIENKVMTIEMLKRSTGDAETAFKTTGGVKVADHAIVRFMERVLGINMQDLVNQMVSIENGALVTALKNGRVPLADRDCVLIFKNQVVVTIITKLQRRNQLPKHTYKGKKKKSYKH